MIQGQQSPSPSDPWQQLLDAIGQTWPSDRWSDLGIVVGCSGGADSVALLRALCELRKKCPTAQGFLVAAHFNHGVRGAQADSDADFVRQLARALDVQHAVGIATGEATDEASMRTARNAFLRQTAQNAGARYVAVAHSLDDNMETVLHNLMRGTGPKGLAGMPMTRPLSQDPVGRDLVLIRPMLSVRRQLIRDGLRRINQSWCEDSTNQDTAYRRNWIRRELLPLMQSQYPSVTEAMARAAQLQSEWKLTIDALADQWFQQHATLAAIVRIRRDDSTPSTIVITALQHVWTQSQWPQGEMTHDHWQRLANTISGLDDERYSLPGDIDVRATGQEVELHC